MHAIEPQAWHLADVAAVAARLGTDLQRGLSEADVVRRREEQGGVGRSLPATRRHHGWTAYGVLPAFALLAAASGLAVLERGIEAVVVAGLALLHVVMAVRQERDLSQRGRRDLAPPTHAWVLREGRKQSVPVTALVAGDLVLLEAGERAPAALRLVEVQHLRLLETQADGQAIAAPKQAGPTEAPVQRVPPCSVEPGTLVLEGAGTGIVLPPDEAAAEASAASRPERSWVLRRLGKGTTHGAVALGLLAGVVLAVASRGYGRTGTELLLPAVVLVVLAMPVALPHLLARGLGIARSMLRDRRIDLPRAGVLENLDTVTLLAVDDAAGVLHPEVVADTVVTAEGYYHVAGRGYSPRGGVTQAGRAVALGEERALADLGRALLLTADTRLEERDGRWRAKGDPVAGALEALAHKLQPDTARLAANAPRLDAMARLPGQPLRATLCATPSGHVVLLSGTPERVLERCGQQRLQHGDAAVNVGAWNEAVAHLATTGRRVVAVAWKLVPASQTTISFGELGDGFTLLGLIGLRQPVRQEAGEVRRALQSAGVKLLVVSDEAPRTVAAWAEDLALTSAAAPVGEAVVGEPEVGKVLGREVGGALARVSAAERPGLVAALQARGERVAWYGSRMSEAAALQQAEVGLVGSAGDGPVPPADLVVHEGGLAPVLAALQVARTWRAHVRQAVRFVVPLALGGALLVLGAVALDWTLPVSPLAAVVLVVQMTFIVATALAGRPGDEVTQWATREPSAPLVRLALRFQWVALGGFFAALAGAAYGWTGERAGDVGLARGVVLASWAAIQVAHAWSCRSLQRGGDGGAASVQHPALLPASAVVLLVQLLVFSVPSLRAALGVEQLDRLGVATAAGAGVLAFAVSHLMKPRARSAAGGAGGGPGGKHLRNQDVTT